MEYLGEINLDKLEAYKKNLTVISLFTGCGGFDLGMAMAGFGTRVMVEWDKTCCETLRANIKQFTKDRVPVIIQDDITKVTTEQILKAGDLTIGEATAVIGGPPCQGFSVAGLRMIDDPRNKLYKEFVRVVKEALPLTFIFENVPGLVSMAKGEIIKQVCKDFAESGYDISWDILNAADYGVPQHRRRVFIIGKRVDALIINGEKMSYHIGAKPGEIRHPAWFKKRHNLDQSSLNNF